MNIRTDCSSRSTWYEVCLQLVKEESKRLKAERRERLRRRLATIIAARDDSSDDDEDDDFEAQSLGTERR